MKGTLVVALLLLAGCTAPVEDEPDLWQACPQWVVGETAALNATIEGTESLLVDDSIVPSRMGERPFDMVVLTLRPEGSMELKLEVDGGRVLLHTDAARNLPALQFSQEVVVQAFLSDVTHGAAAPGAPLLRFTGNGDVDVQIEPYYRVCGAPDVPES